ncbi:hypothetical protein SLS58_005863 [Diplodia intermedia]|uniref:Uncharacterized protein n=1 Tax=Diplodia intermedia TaxID=856260 RepID=A0ABR3TPP8_9PEZI
MPIIISGSQTVKTSPNKPSSRNEQNGHLAHRASIAIGEQYSQHAYQQEYQTRRMGEPIFSAPQEQFHQLRQQSQQQMQQSPAADNNNSVDRSGSPWNNSVAVQDYQMQLMLLEQQNKRRLSIHRREQGIARLAAQVERYRDIATAPPPSSSPSSYHTAGFDLKY